MIIPTPKVISWNGAFVPISRRTHIVIARNADSLVRSGAEAVQHQVELLGGPRIPIIDKPSSINGNIVIAEAQTNNDLVERLKFRGIVPAHEEGYALLAGGRSHGTSAIVMGRDVHGAYYGAQTLCQMLIKRHGVVSIVGAKVVDYPTLAWRGAHLFCGSQALPFHERLIANVFARFKLNHLVLQCEQAKWDTLGSTAPKWAMSKKDLRADIAFAQAHGMTVTPLVNSVGHMQWLLLDPARRGFAEDPATPYAACATDPAVDAFMDKLYDEVLDTFHSPTLHIGGDEVTICGRYPYRSKSQYHDFATTYTAYVNKLHDHLKVRGAKTMMWGDELLEPGTAKDACNAPDATQANAIANGLPKDIIVVDWHYTPVGPFPSPNLLRSRGFVHIIGGTWNDPRNIGGFSRSLADGHDDGLLQTTWVGYNSNAGNLQSSQADFTAFVIAAEESWNGGKVSVDKLPYSPSRIFQQAYARSL